MSRVINYGFHGMVIPEEEWGDLCVVFPGWQGILRSLIGDLFNLGWDGYLLQIKEKFGGLRFYIGSGTPEMHDRIIEAERESLRTCIECGEPGRAINTGWILTLCQSHIPASWISYELLDSDSDTDSAAV